MALLIPHLSPGLGVLGYSASCPLTAPKPGPASVDRARRGHYPVSRDCFPLDRGEGCGERIYQGCGWRPDHSPFPNSLLKFHKPKKGNLWIWGGGKGKRNRPFPPLSWKEKSQRPPHLAKPTFPSFTLAQNKGSPGTEIKQFPVLFLLFVCCFETGSLAQVGVKPAEDDLALPPAQGWDYRHAPPGQVYVVLGIVCWFSVCKANTLLKELCPQPQAVPCRGARQGAKDPSLKEGEAGVS